MKDSHIDFDLIILGAGISGLGMALTAVEQGLSVCVLEKDLVARSTSNNSLRIIHGGLRYLQRFDLKRVFESASDQTYCLKKWPNLIQPLDCFLPLSGKGLKKSSLAAIACLLYTWVLSISKSPLKGPNVRSNLDSTLSDIFTNQGEQGFLNWTDALIAEPTSLAFNIIKLLEQKGCLVRQNSEVVSFSQSSTAVEVKYLDSEQKTHAIKAQAMVSCLGPGVNRTAKIFDCKWAIAFNLILNKQYSTNHAFSCDGQEGRHFFFVPRGSRTVLGTDYYETINPEQALAPTQSQINEFLQSAASSMPNLNLSPDNIEQIEWGVIPVKGFKSTNHPNFFGSSLIKADRRVVHILATKYTGFRSQSLKALKLVKDKICVG